MVRKLRSILLRGIGPVLGLVLCLLLLALKPAVVWGLEIKAIEVNQAIGNQYKGHMNFVAGKNTVVRAFLTESVTFSKQIKLLGLENTKVVVKNTTTGKSFELKPKSYNGATTVVDFRCPSMSQCENWAAGDYVFEVTVKGVTKTTQNAYQFKERKSLKILAVPVKGNYKGVVVPYPNENYKTLWKFTRDVYPVADDGIKWKTGGQLDASAKKYDLKTSAGEDALLVALNNLNPEHCTEDGNASASDCYDIVAGFIPKQPSIGAGYTRGKPSVVVTGTDADANASVAHETAHCYEIGDTYEDGYFNCPINPAPSEWEGKDWNNPKKTIKCLKGPEAYEEIGAKIPAAAHAYDVNGSGDLGVKADYMGREGNQTIFWTTPEVYDHLFKSFAPSVASSLVSGSSPQRLIVYKGFITEGDNTITLDPWESYTDSVDIPDSIGTFTIKALDAGANVLATQAMKVSFYVRSNPPRHVKSAPFRGAMRFPEGTAKFQIVRASDGTILKEIPVSANPPVVANVSPTTPGVVISGEYLITWTGQDTDGDELSYKVEYNPDPSNSASQGMILAAGLKETQWTANFDQLPGGANATIRVSVTDGILTASALSAAFTVAVKSPQVFIDELPWGKDYEYGAAILLDGEAYDLNDGWLPDDKIEWRSDLSGVLGFGSPLMVESLQPGEHTITLTATNSAGLQSSDQVKLTVSECTYAVSPTSLGFKAVGGAKEVQVTASQPLGESSVCTLTNDDLSMRTYDDGTWLEAKVTSFLNNQGVVEVSLKPNDSKYLRTGTVSVYGNEVKVTQQGALCKLEIGTTSQNFQQEGGTGTIQVDVINGCDIKWWANKDRTWITITSGKSGKGDGTVNFKVSPNPTNCTRTGHIWVNNKLFTVTQYPGSGASAGKSCN